MNHSTVIAGFAALMVVLATVFVTPKKTKFSCPKPHMRVNIYKGKKSCVCIDDYHWDPTTKQCVHSKLKIQSCAQLIKKKQASWVDPQGSPCGPMASEEGYSSCTLQQTGSHKGLCCCIH